MKENKIILLLILLSLCSFAFQVVFAEPARNEGNLPAINASTPGGVWQQIQELQDNLNSLSNQELIDIIGQGGQNALFAMQELIGRGGDAVSDIMDALKDPDTQNAALLTQALVKIAKDDPNAAKDILAGLGEIANSDKYSDAQRVAAATAMALIGGKGALAGVDKEIQLQVAANFLEKSYDVHSTKYWHDKPGNHWDPWPNK